MKKTSRLLLLLATLFLSTFFVGCKPQEEPIALEDISLSPRKKVVEKINPKPVEIEQQQSPDNQFEIESENAAENPTNVVLRGMVFLSDGLPVTNKFVVSVVPSKELKGELFKGNISPECDGSFVISNLIPGNAELQFLFPGCNLLTTNIYLVLPETELEIIFQDNPMTKISGVVLQEQDDQPIEGITVKASVFDGGPPYSSCITDEDGKFSLVLRESYAGVFDEIVVDEPGYGKVRKNVSYGTTFVKIILGQSGWVIGKVMTEDKKPVSGVDILLNLISFKKNSNNNLKKGDYLKSFTTISDAKGNYEFSNINAPAKYGFEVNGLNSGFSLPDYYDGKGFTVEIEPNKTSVYDLIVQKVAVLAFKAIDDYGNPFLKYELNYSMKFGNYTTLSDDNINLSDDDWYYIKTMYGGAGLLSCRASENETRLHLITNNIPFSGKGTNYITLIFPYSEPNITGFILKPDGSPAKNCSVGISCKKNHAGITADETGYFEARGFNAEKGESINVNAYLNPGKFNISTNLPSGSRDVVLILLQPCKIIGRVFLNNLDTPAKSFTINQDGHRVVGKNSQDGSFSLVVSDHSMKKKKTGTLKIYTSGYSSETVKYDFSNGNNCDFGNIILKSEPKKWKE